jgi:hypothetical protein
MTSTLITNKKVFEIQPMNITDHYLTGPYDMEIIIQGSYPIMHNDDPMSAGTLYLRFWTRLKSSVPITTEVVSSNATHDKVYSIQDYVINFVSDIMAGRWFSSGTLI